MALSLTEWKKKKDAAGGVNPINTSTAPSFVAPQTTGGTLSLSEYMNQKRSKADSTDVNMWLSSADRLMSQYNDTISAWRAKDDPAYQALYNERSRLLGMAQGYRNQYQGNAEALKAIDDVVTSLSSLSTKKAQDYYSQWESAEQYNTAKHNYDLYQKYNPYTQEQIDAELAGMDQQNPDRAWLEDYSRQKKYLDLDKNADFAQNSQYESTKKGEARIMPSWDGGAFVTDTGYDDILYDYINRNQDAIATQNINDINSYATRLGVDKGHLQQMTDDQIARFNYLYKTQSSDAAYEYIKSIEPGLNAMNRQKEMAYWEEYAGKHPVISSGLSFVTNLDTTLSFLGQVGDYLEDGQIDQNAGYNRSVYITNTIRGAADKVIQEKWGPVGSFLYQRAMNTGDQVLRTFLSGGYGTGLSKKVVEQLTLLTMASGASASMVVNAKDRGLDETQTIALGVIAGAAEYISEKIGFDALFNANLRADSVKKYLLKNMASEGLEEFVSGAANLVADLSISGDRAEVRIRAEEIARERGISIDEAFGIALGEQALEIGKDMLGGAFSGGLMAGVSSYFGYHSSVDQTADVDNLIRQSLEINPDNQMAKDIQAKFDAKQKVTPVDIDRLQGQYETDVKNAFDNDRNLISDAAATRLSDLGETGDVNAIAQAIGKYIQNRSDSSRAARNPSQTNFRSSGLTGAERQLILNSRYGQQVLNELNTNSLIQANEQNRRWTGEIGTRMVRPEMYGRFIQNTQTEQTAPAAEQQTAAPISPEAWMEQQTRPKSVPAAGQNTETTESVAMTGREKPSNASGRFHTIVPATRMTQANKAVPAAVNDMASDYGNQAAAIRSIYNMGTNKDLTVIAPAIRAAYEIGLNGGLESAAMNDSSTRALTPAQRSLAYRVGVAAANKAPKRGNASRRGTVHSDNFKIGGNKYRRMIYKAVNFLAEESGISIKINDSQGKGVIQGGFNKDTDVLTLDISADINSESEAREAIKYAALRTFSHELTHFGQKWSSQDYNALTATVLEVMADRYGDEFIEDRIRYWQERYKNEVGQVLSTADAIDEIVAESMTEVLPESQFFEKLIQRSQPTASRLIDALKSFIARLRQYFRNLDTNIRPEVNALMADTGDGTLKYLEGIVEQWDRMMLNAVENYNRALAEEEAAPATAKAEDIDQKGIQSIQDQKAELEQARAVRDAALRFAADDMRAEVDATTQEIENNEYAEEAVQHSLRVTEPELLNRLNAEMEKGEYDPVTNPDGGYITVYRSYQVIDGGLYPPMNAVDRDENGRNKKRGFRSEYGVWEMATEAPELARSYMERHPEAKYAKFDLDGIDNKTGGVDYAPYLHSSNMVLNDQFSAAYRRNLVVVECRVPVSEMNDAYRAEYAKNGTGWHDWKKGLVAGKLAKLKPEYSREVFLSRYMMPVRRLSDAEVADMYKEYLSGTNLSVPWNVVTPGLRNALENAGVKIDYSDKKIGTNTVRFADTQENVQYALRDYNSMTYEELTEEQIQLTQRENEISERKKAANNSTEYIDAVTEYMNLVDEAKELLEKRKRGESTPEENARIIVLRDLRKAASQRIEDVSEKLGLTRLVEEEREIRNEREALRQAADAAWEREGAEKENAAIEKSGLSAPEYFRRKALRAFKTTTNFNEAGYLLPDGRMLNFSGGERNHRYRDHREIGEIYEATSGTAALNRFLNDGNIRVMAESPGIDLAAGIEPTREQYAAIRKFINTIGTQEKQFYIDFSNADGSRANTLSYDGNVNASDILNDIKRFYQSGGAQQRSELMQFHVQYSIRNIVGQQTGKDYGIGVYLDSTVLNDLTDKERIRSVKDFVKSIGGSEFTAYDQNGDAVAIRIAEHDKRFTNVRGKNPRVTKDLTNKHIDYKTKQEAVVLVDELIEASNYSHSDASTKSHDWLDNYGTNNWDYWKVYIQDKENTVWEATLNIANTKDGEKILYDIDPIKMVEQAIKLATSTTENSITQPNTESQPPEENSSAVQRSLRSVNNDYIAAIENGATGEAQRLVKEYAEAQGFDTENAAYHGTDAFGFTRFNMAAGRNAIFVAYSKDIAQTYTRGGDARDVSTGETDIFSSKTYNEIAKDFQEQIKTLYGRRITDAWYVSREELTGMLESERERLTAPLKAAQWTDAQKENAIAYMAERSGVKASELSGIRTPAELESALFDHLTGLNGKFTADLPRRILSPLITSFGQTEDGNRYTMHAADELLNDVYSLLKNAAQPEGIIEYETDGGKTESIAMYKARHMLRERTGGNYEGVYQLYTRPGRQLIIDAGGAKSNRIMWNSAVRTTREIAEYAKDNGYTSVRINNIDDNGGKNRDIQSATGDIGIFFNAEDVKSADPITYDNQGNVIPLSERFSQKEDDIRYSLRTPTYTNRELLEKAANDVSITSGLTQADRSALEIFKSRLDKLRGFEEQQAEQRRILQELNAAPTPDRDEIIKTQNRINLLGRKISAAENLVLDVENKQTLKKVLQHARNLAGNQVRRNERARLQERSDVMKYRDRVKAKAKRLSDMILKNSDKEHVPAALRGPLADFVSSIDFSSQRLLKGGPQTKKDIKYTETLDRVRQVLQNQLDYMKDPENANNANGVWIDMPQGFTEAIQQHINKVNAAVEKFRYAYTNQVNAMDAAELKDLDFILTTISTSINKINTIHTAGRFAGIAEASEATITETGKKKADSGKAENLRGFLEWNNTLPYYAFKRYGAAGQQIFEGLQNGWDKLAFNAKQINDFAAKAYTAKQAKEWSNQVHTIELLALEDGKGTRTIKMTTAQIMSLYCLSLRDQAKQHIYGGGIRVGNIDAKVKGQKKQTIRQTTPFLVTRDDVDTILSVLEKNQPAMRVAIALQNYMNTVGTKWGNDVSMERFGYNAFEENHYFPIQVDQTNLPAIDPEARSNDLFRLLNLSMTKALTPKANNALVVNDIFDVFAAHMSDMAKYNALALPILDAMKWYNYKSSTTNEKGQISTQTVQRAIETAFGKNGGSYFINFMKDMNGTSNGGRDEGALNAAMSNYKVASVAANLRVALLQPTAYLRASAVLSPKVMAKAAAMSQKKAHTERMKYSGVSVWKDLGYFDTNIGRSIQEQIKHTDTLRDKIVDKTLWFAQKGDSITWDVLWNACLLDQQLKGVKKEDLMEETAKRFRDVVFRTQVFDSTMSRTQLMRDKSALVKNITGFMSEPSVSYNLLLDAYEDFNDEAKIHGKGSAWAKTGRAVTVAAGAYAVSQIAAAIIESVADAWRDDDEYESYFTKWLEAFWGDEGKWYEGNLISDLNPLTKLPLLKDLFSVIRGYESTNMTMQWLEDLFSLKDAWASDKRPLYGKIYKTLQAASRIVGLPLSNAAREVATIWNNTAGVLTGAKLKTYDPGAKTAIKEAYQAGHLSEKDALKELVAKEITDDENDAYWTVEGWKNGTTSNYAKVYEAMKAGKGFEAAMKEMTDHGYKEKKVITQIKSTIGDWYKGTDTKTPSIGEREAVSLLVKYGNLSEDDAKEKVKGWKSSLDTGYSLTEVGEALTYGEITQNEAEQIWETYGGYTPEEAHGKAVAALLEDKYPDWETASIKGASTKYQQYGKGLMSESDFIDAMYAMKDYKGTDNDGDGETDTGSVQAQRWAYIDSLPISNAQKDALHLAYYKETTLKKTPWHQ